MTRQVTAVVSFVLIAFSFSLRSSWTQDDVTRFVPSSAFAAVFCQPKDAINQPGMELMPREILSVAGKKELGFDPTEITEFLAIVDTIDDPEGPPNFGMLLRFDSQQSPGENLLHNTERTTLDGKTLYRANDPFGASFIIIDELTFLIGSEPFLKKMLNASGANSALLSMIEKDPPDDHLNVYVAVEPIRAFVKQVLAAGKNEIPPPFRRYLAIPDLLNGITLTSRFGEGSEMNVELIATSPNAASELDQMLTDGVDLAKQMILAQVMNEMPEQDPDLQQAMHRYFERVADHLQSEFSPRVSGDRLVWSFQNEYGVATMGIGVALLLPAVQQVREAARRTDSANRLRQLAIAMHHYHDAYKRLPATANYSDDGKPLLSWRVHVLPYIEEYELYEQFRLDEPWDSEHNIKLLSKMPDAYRNPNLDLDEETVYLAVAGPGTVFDGKDGKRLETILDGTSRTIMLVEADPDHAVPWTKPDDWTLNPGDPWKGLGNLRPAGLTAAFCDGSVQVISRETAADILRSLFDPSDGR